MEKRSWWSKRHRTICAERRRTSERDVTVVSQPPTVSVDSDQHYLYLGMADLATFNVSGGWTQAGVQVGDQTFRAWPMPGGKSGLFSLFAFAWNMPAGHDSGGVCGEWQLATT